MRLLVDWKVPVLCLFSRAYNSISIVESLVPRKFDFYHLYLEGVSIIQYQNKNPTSLPVFTPSERNVLHTGFFFFLRGGCSIFYCFGSAEQICRLLLSRIDFTHVRRHADVVGKVPHIRGRSSESFWLAEWAKKTFLPHVLKHSLGGVMGNVTLQPAPSPRALTPVAKHSER